METHTQQATGTRNLEAHVLENDFLRAVVLPAAGGRIWQVTDKLTGTDLLWNNPAIAPSLLPTGSSYDEHWSGGWDDLFPNDEAAEFAGLQLPDHGELWTAPWTLQRPGKRDAAEEFILNCKTAISNFAVEKRLRLAAGERRFTVDYKLTNCGESRLPFLFKLHPAFAVDEGDRIDVPCQVAALEPEFRGTLMGDSFDWPYFTHNGSSVDMRRVPAADSGAVHFFYGTGLRKGWCGITRRQKKLSVALQFDHSVFSCCWLFATHGGWKNLNVAVLEPATGHPFRLQKMMEHGTARWLSPGETLETQVLFTVQEGLDSIGGIGADGALFAAID